MDWARAIERNSEALVGIVEALFAMLGLVGSDTVGRIPQSLHSAVLRILRPAESAVRRLVVIAARGLIVKAVPARPMPALPIGKGRGLRRGSCGSPPTTMRRRSKRRPVSFFAKNAGSVFMRS